MNGNCTPVSKISTGDQNPIQVLLVEDNPINQLVARNLLKQMGCLTDVANNGRQALEALAKKDYHVVLMDLQMPEMDGLEATQLIRKTPNACRNPRIPIIGVTARACASDREQCLAAGMDDYLAKPIRPAHLAEAIRQVLVPRALPSSPSADPKPASADPRIFDPAVLGERLEGDQALIDLILQKFVATLPAQLELIKNATRECQAEKVELLAHSLKGSAAEIGAQALREAAGALEMAGHTRDLADALALVNRLETEWNRFKITVACPVSER